MIAPKAQATSTGFVTLARRATIVPSPVRDR
jgi:hypothetical protein